MMICDAGAATCGLVVKGGRWAGERRKERGRLCRFLTREEIVMNAEPSRGARCGCSLMRTERYLTSNKAAAPGARLQGRERIMA